MFHIAKPERFLGETNSSKLLAEETITSIWVKNRILHEVIKGHFIFDEESTGGCASPQRSF